MVSFAKNISTRLYLSKKRSLIKYFIFAVSSFSQPYKRAVKWLKRNLTHFALINCCNKYSDGTIVFQQIFIIKHFKRSKKRNILHGCNKRLQTNFSRFFPSENPLDTHKFHMIQVEQFFKYSANRPREIFLERVAKLRWDSIKKTAKKKSPRLTDGVARTIRT